MFHTKHFSRVRVRQTEVFYNGPDLAGQLGFAQFADGIIKTQVCKHVPTANVGGDFFFHDIRTFP